MWTPLCLLLLFELIRQDAVSGLRVVMLDVPSPTKSGESVELSCIYDLESDRLYSVKWYKNGYEFYRYVPKDFPPAQYLPIPGIKVDTEKSDRNKVHIRYVDLNSAGVYRCEISAEAPSFNTAADEKEMNIYVLPKEGPKVTMEQSEYEPTELLAANCSSAKSKPPATLRWLLNRKPISGPEYEVQYSTVLHADGLESSLLTLRFRLVPAHFHQGALQLKCAAFVREFGAKFKHEAIQMAYDRRRRRKLMLDYDVDGGGGTVGGGGGSSGLMHDQDGRHSDNLNSSSRSIGVIIPIVWLTGLRLLLLLLL